MQSESPFIWADVTLTLMGRGSAWELLVGAVVVGRYEARISGAHSEGIALALFHVLYWMVAADMYFSIVCIPYKRKNGQC